MENASKALLMGAGVLLAVLIIFIAVRLFSSASQVTESYQSKTDSTEIATFNANFTRFVGATFDENGNEKEQTYAKIHDIISVANFAWNYNNKVLMNPMDPTNLDDPRIIHVNLKLSDGTELIEDLQNYNQSAYYLLMEKGYYVSNDNPNGKNVVTYQIDIKNYNAEGRINEMDFYPSNQNSATTINANLKEATNEIKNNEQKYKR